MNKLVLAVLCAAIVFILSSCNKTDEGVGIIVKTESGEINAVVKSRSVESVDYGDGDTELFQTIMNDSSAGIPYVKLGETIDIAISGEGPESYQLMDYILNEDGTVKYEQQKQTAQPINITLNDGGGSFVLEENKWVYFSSDNKDYEPGAAIRGFRLTGDWKGEIKEYVFIIRTDAHKKG